jgi:hypothetical protein
VTHIATRGVANDYQTPTEKTEADDSRLSVPIPGVFGFCSQSVKDVLGILEIQAAIDQGPLALGWVEGDLHAIIVYTAMAERKGSRAGPTALFRALLMQRVQARLCEA